MLIALTAPRIAKRAQAKAIIKSWPKETKQAEEQIRSRQQVNEAANATTIDLKPYINTELADSPMCPKGNQANNLAELPLGVNIYAGIPFDIKGSIQLMGGWLKHYRKKYPSQVENIEINKRCTKLHLLHAAGSVAPKLFGTSVAKLVLHYADGSTQEVNIVAGEQVFDWWAPLFTTGLDPRMKKMAPGTEPAWTGSNSYLKKFAPDLSLCLYKSTFDNPQPAVAISKIDYVSTLTDACPFLVGLTIE